MAWQTVTAHWKAHTNQLHGSQGTQGFLMLVHLPLKEPQKVPFSEGILWRTTAKQCSICCATLLTMFYPVTHTVALVHILPHTVCTRGHILLQRRREKCKVLRNHSSWCRLCLPGEVSRDPSLWCSHSLSHHSTIPQPCFPLSWVPGHQECKLQ